MKTLIIGNWKCNPISFKKAKELFDLIKKGIANSKEKEIVLCPPFVWLFGLSSVKIQLGAQNCFWEESGPYTGEISSKMLENLGCKYVIIGHSERRKYFNETDEIINKKISSSLKLRLKVIFCVGETIKERNSGEVQRILKSQIKNAFKGISHNKIKDLIIAYEPVWAISNKACNIDEAMTNLLIVRKIISQIYSASLARKIRIIYGGSVNSKNCKDFIEQANFNGLLIGKASLNSKEFIKIVKNI